MNYLLDFSPTNPRSTRPAAKSLNSARRGVALLLIWLLMPLAVIPLAAFGQEAPPPPPDQSQGGYDQGPPQAYNPLNPDQLDQLVAPIALYPDSLVAQVLAASTYPTQVVDADRFVEANRGISPDQMAQMVDNQPWDPSIKALTAFPSVLANMDRNLDWTTQLGNAYYNQPQDVMNAVQVMRQEAYQRGDLRSTPQMVVTYAPSNIVIVPANPAVVYVPYYDPWTVWGFRPWYRWYAPPPPRGIYYASGFRIGFGYGVVIGVWSHWGWGWGHWRMGWGPHPYIDHDRHMYVPYRRYQYGRFDRGVAARNFNRTVEMRGRAARSQEMDRRMEQHQYRPQNDRRAAPNRPEYRQPQNREQQRNANRPQNDRRSPPNRPQSQQQEHNLNRPAQNDRPQQNRNFERPQQRPEQPHDFNRPQPQHEARPQPQHEARPKPGNERPHNNHQEKPHGDHGPRR